MLWLAELNDWWYPELDTMVRRPTMLTSLRQRLGQLVRSVR